MSDQHRGQAMTHAGDPNLRTPHMDRLATGGASFRRAYANCPVCTPSRGTIFSGRHAHAGPVAGFFDVFKPSAPSTATVLRAHGYRTAYIGKWHCGIIFDQAPPEVKQNLGQYPGSPYRTPENFRGGFEEWAAFEAINAPFQTYVYRNEETAPQRLTGYQTDVLTDLAIQRVQAHDARQPLFLVLSVEPPHFPCLAPEAFRRFDPARLQVRPNFGRLHPAWPGTPVVDDSTLRQILANYYAMVENLDHNIGRLIAAVEQSLGVENCLLVYFSDHGDYVGSHGMWLDKVYEHEESVRVPAIFHWPGAIPARGGVDGLFSLVDLLPTTLGLAGLPVPPWCQGTDWSARLRGADVAGPTEVLLEMQGVPRWEPRFQDWRGLVTDRWKYAFYEDRRETLYDLEADPYELNDLAPSAPDLCAEMRERLLRLLRATREPYFDVIIEHGVAAATPRYLVDMPTKLNNIRWAGGL
ncbi:MAG: sulfatase-like hydrolase/transferase [Chloroflexi bacterium]|nr:sulfatase-like hydrolase/transferase [Chloroflexota bacterium]